MILKKFKTPDLEENKQNRLLEEQKKIMKNMKNLKNVV